MTKPKSFPAKVVGVSHKNKDGTRRQKIIKECWVGEDLVLLPEPDNPVSNYAIKVCLSTGEQIGYLPDRLAGEVARLLEKGGSVQAHITDLTGGEPGKPTRGVNIEITKFTAGATPADKAQNLGKKLRQIGCVLTLCVTIPIIFIALLVSC